MEAGNSRHMMSIEEELTQDTIKTPKMIKVEHKLGKLAHKRVKLHRNIRLHTETGKTMLQRDVRRVKKSRLIFPGEKTVYDSKGKKYRIFFKRTGREDATSQDYRHYLNVRRNVRFRNRQIRRRLVSSGRKLFDDGYFRDDEYTAEFHRHMKKYSQRGQMAFRSSVRRLRLNHNAYSRLERIKDRQKLLSMKHVKLHNKAIRGEYKAQISSASSQYQKRRLKKEMASAIRKNEGNWVRRTRNELFIKKKSIGQKIRALKRIASTAIALGVIGILLFAVFGMGLLFFAGTLQGVGIYAEEAITQNDYGTLSESTAYLKKLETDMEEYLLDKESLEDELQLTYGSDIYEFVYELAEFGFSSTTLMAYLSAKYVSFSLDQIQAELDEIFGEMYVLDIEIKEEPRQVIATDPDTGEETVVVELKKICYVKLIKKELEDVVAERMTDKEKEKYDTYKLSSGGQQVYGPVMMEDWTDLISSDYGERIHPVTGERTFHNGIDIAIPTGTNLYSAVSGVVTVAQYSETAGNFIRVQTDSGWVVTFMHMDALAVSAGQEIEKGDFVGHSGNSGRSTGPHLHLEVRDAQGEPINPIFIVPQNCFNAGEENT